MILDGPEALWRLASTIAWSIATMFFAPAFYRVMRMIGGRSARSLDLIWTTAFLLSMNRVLFGLRGLYVPDSLSALIACHGFSIVGCGLLIAVWRMYGRHDA